MGKERKLNRWEGYDYNQFGYYFITICIENRIECLGKVEDGKMILNDYGEIVLKYWQEILRYYENVGLDEFQIMPNHIHGNIFITDKTQIGADNVGTEYYSVPTQTDSPNQAAPICGFRPRHYGLLSKIIKSFKHAATKEIRQRFNDYKFRWQRSFHDRVIRNEKELINIREYIKNNPVNWQNDRNNPINIKK